MDSSTMFQQLLRIIVAAAMLTAQLLPAAAAHSANPGLELLMQKAQSLEARGREDLAAQVWQQILVASPDDPVALAHLARWAKHNQQNDQASAFLERLRKVDPSFVQTQPENALDTATKAKSRLDEAGRLAAAQHFSEAMAIYREVFGSTPPAGNWAISYYETLAGTQGGVEPALVALKRLAAEYPNVPDYDLSVGRLMIYNPATRLAGVNRLAAIDGSTTLALKAKAAWRQALLWEKLNPAYAASAKLYITRYSDPELDAATLAMRTHEVAKIVPPRAGDKEVQLGYIAMKAGSFEEAKTHFQEALTQDEGNPRAHEGLGFAAMKEGNFDGAVQEFELAKGSASSPEVRTALNEARFWKTMHAASKSLEAQDWKSAVDLYQSALAQRFQSGEALSGLSGALMAAQEPGKALPYLKRLVAQQPASVPAWCSLAKASLEASGPSAALQIVSSPPSAIGPKLAESVEWKAIQALVYKESGDTDRAQSLYREVLGSDTHGLSADGELELAHLSLQFNQPSQSATYASRAVELAPKNASAWETLLSSLLAARRPADAKRIFESMPRSAVEVSSRHIGFQESCASLKEFAGDLDGARTILLDLTNDRTRVSKQQLTGLKLHLADLDSKLGDNQDALAILNGLAAAEADNLAVWRARILVLNTMKQPAEVVNSFADAPQSVALKLRQDGDLLSVIASAYAAEGRRDYAIRLLDTYTLQPSTLRSETKIAQKLQLGWLLLDSPDASAHLYRLLGEIDAEPAITADFRKQLTDIWATWILRSAEVSQKAANPARALALLEQGTRAYPSNAKLQSALAGNLLATGDTKRALNVYANWGLTDAHPDDFAGAVGAALSQRDLRTAEAWIANGLSQWPNNPKLLSLAGDLSQSKGDLKHAKAYWKQALSQETTQPVLAASLPSSEEAHSANLRLLLVGAVPETSSFAQTDNNVRLERSTAFGAGVPLAPVGVHLSTYRPAAAAALPETGTLSELRRPLLSPEPKAELSLADSLQDKLASVESRNTPYVSSSMSVWGRGGQAGFGRLLVQEEDIEASATIANTLRASLLLKPTYLSGGTGDGSGTNLFGQQTKPAAFGIQNQSGVAGEAELSSQSIGLRIGSTPRGFLTNNWVGGFRLQPWNGPITFLVERDNVKETVLSYGGARDPQSGQIWGGVMADSFSLQGHWDDGNSGLYASAAYQILDGRHVAANTAINGNVGSWWKVASISGGSLIVGTNFSAMHYDHNLRYFTYGQGGYFSPQQYYLFNLPVHWSGTYGRLQYAAGASIGLQHFAEDSSAYYPTEALLQSQQNMRYAAAASTGINFSFDTRVAYQLAPHWMLGAFGTANNARNYTAYSTGLFVKYTFEERPMNFMTEASSIPNWRGQDPLKF